MDVRTAQRNLDRQEGSHPRLLRCESRNQRGLRKVAHTPPSGRMPITKPVGLSAAGKVNDLLPGGKTAVWSGGGYRLGVFPAAFGKYRSGNGAVLVMGGGRAVLERIGASYQESLRLDRIVSPDQHSTAEMVLVDSRHAEIGRLRFRMCDACRTGLILDVWILDGWQRQGLGRELVHTLVAYHSGVRWSTTRQTLHGRPFFSAMTEETLVPFPRCGALCAHLEGRFTRAWRRLTSRRRSPSADTATY